MAPLNPSDNVITRNIPYKALIFDFFGVVCSEVAPFWLALHLSPSEAANAKSTIVHKADLGEASQEEMFLALSQLTDVPPKQIEREWWSYVRIDMELVTLIDSLRKKYRVALLTNSPSQFVREIRNCPNLR
jgi:FMN phosphatase YigB (HAD superfamily)